MTQTPAIAMVVQAKSRAEQGVDYSSRHGALCPWCKTRAKTYCTRPWDGVARVRFHRCINPACVLATIGTSIKSLEADHNG